MIDDDALIAKLQDLIDENEQWPQLQIEIWRDDLIAILDRAARDRKDALRYRWLRDPHSEWESALSRPPDEMDAWIDAAIREQAKGS